MLNNFITVQLEIFLNISATIWPIILTIIAGFLLGRIFITWLKYPKIINRNFAIFCFGLIGIFLVATQGDRALYSVYTTLGGVLLAEIIDREKPHYFEIVIALLMMSGTGFFIMGGVIAILIALICFVTSIFLIKRIPAKRKTQQTSKTTFKKMSEQVYLLELEELQNIKWLVIKHIEDKEKNAKLTDIQKKLLASGLVKKNSSPTERPVVQRKLIQVKGKPISETIIEERR